MDKKWKNRIIQAMRRLSFSYPPRTETKRKARVAPSTYECKLCGIYLYDGKSVNNFEKIREQYPNTIMEKGKLDHIIPVRDSGVDFTWESFVEGLFCEESNFQYICKPCHDKKTEIENKHRVKQRKSKK